jgi:hypothetical protein
MIQTGFAEVGRLVPGSLSAVSEAPRSRELGVEALWRGA